MQLSYAKENRTGDHRWWISDTRKFRTHYPDWMPTESIDTVIREVAEGLARRAA
jgi:CDP-paratose 2-epimerase